MNLVSNAVKFTKTGYILISLEGHQKGNAYNLRFEVKDTGRGIPLDKQAYIFEKFSQAEEDSTRIYGGSGLGLTICRKLVTLMNGDIGVRSVEGEGATFWGTVTLGFDKSVLAVLSAPPHVSGEKILVDCKYKLRRTTLINHLQSCGNHCADVGQGRDVISMLQQDVALGQPYDFVLFEVDENLTDTEVVSSYIQNIYNASPHTSIVLMVVPGKAYDFESITLKESVAVLTKPVFPQELFDVLTKLVEHKRDDLILPKFIYLNEDNVTTELESELLTSDQMKTKDIKILIAEDQKVNQMLMRTVLGQFGYEADVASNGIEAVRLSAENAYDLIFMDGHMPEMDGLEATKQIREFEVRLKRHTPIIALTADAMKGDRDKCLAAGMDDYLHKPVKALQIKQMIEKHISKTSRNSLL